METLTNSLRNKLQEGKFENSFGDIPFVLARLWYIFQRFFYLQDLLGLQSKAEKIYGSDYGNNRKTKAAANSSSNFTSSKKSKLKEEYKNLERLICDDYQPTAMNMPVPGGQNQNIYSKPEAECWINQMGGELHEIPRFKVPDLMKDRVFDFYKHIYGTPGVVEFLLGTPIIRLMSKIHSEESEGVMGLGEEGGQKERNRIENLSNGNLIWGEEVKGSYEFGYNIIYRIIIHVIFSRLNLLLILFLINYFPCMP